MSDSGPFMSLDDIKKWSKALQKHEPNMPDHKSLPSTYHYELQALNFIKLKRQEQEQIKEQELFESFKKISLYKSIEPMVDDFLPPSLAETVFKKSKLPSVDSKPSSPVKIIHWLHQSPSVTCQACGKHEYESTNADIWVVMKKTWERYDPLFRRCTELETTWNIKIDPITFINAPAPPPIILIVQMKADIVEVYKGVTSPTKMSIGLLKLLVDLETIPQPVEIIRKHVPGLFSIKNQLTPEIKLVLKKLLKVTYLNT